MKFNGEAWELFGDVITGEVGHDPEPREPAIGAWRCQFQPALSCADAAARRNFCGSTASPSIRVS